MNAFFDPTPSSLSLLAQSSVNSVNALTWFGQHKAISALSLSNIIFVLLLITVTVVWRSTSAKLDEIVNEDAKLHQASEEKLRQAGNQLVEFRKQMEQYESFLQQVMQENQQLHEEIVERDAKHTHEHSKSTEWLDKIQIIMDKARNLQDATLNLMDKFQTIAETLDAFGN